MTSAQDTLIIDANFVYRHYWRDVWRFRELLYFLVWRDILVRYKQTAFGIAWAIVRPLLTMVAFTIVFGMLAKFPSDGVPYPVLVYAASLPWQFFAGSVNDATNSLVGSANLITKVYFPRIIVPVGTVLTALVDFAVAGFVLGLLMAWYGLWPDWRVILLPLFVLLAFCAALGLGLWLAAFNVKYRDFRYVVPFIIQLGLYLSPVGFSSSVIPEHWRLVYSLNPLVGIIDGFRWALLGGNTPLYVPAVAMSAVIAAVMLATGIWYFKRTERSFADVI